MLKAYLSITVILGIAFLVTQVYTWGALVDNNVYFVGNPGGTFLYVIMGVHGFHLISGIIYLLIVMTGTFQYKVHSKNLLHLYLLITFLL